MLIAGRERPALAISALVIAALAGCTTKSGNVPADASGSLSRTEQFTLPSPASAPDDSLIAQTSPTVDPTAVTLPAQALVARFGDYPAFAATAKIPSVAVFDLPTGARHELRKLSNPQPSGAPLTFLVKDLRGTDWLEVYLPVRPNGSAGWVRAADVAVSALPFRVDVHVKAHRLEVFENAELLGSYPIGVGTQNTPTPGGIFYLKELLKPTNKGGFYGPFAYGLSGFSNVLTKFGKGEGVIGIHGTNDEKTIGKDVSSGCVRLRNKDITALAQLLPLGTPVRILA
ncbi:MAG: L,D-transpeptidase [Mycobacteriales bacterium]